MPREPQIVFSHEYLKLGKLVELPEKSVLLLHVEQTDFKDIEDPFRNYDTVFITAHGRDRFYPLPKQGPCLVLWFTYLCDSREFVFSTMRPWTSWKENYYRSLVGKELKVIIR